MKRTSFITLAIVAVLWLLIGSVQASPLERPMISFTFDDGKESLLTQAFPSLNRFGFVGTAYIPTGYVGLPDQISWDDLYSLSSVHGWEIGNHTVTHPYLTMLSVPDVMAQIIGARTALEQHGMVNVTSFTCPFGDYNQRVINILKSSNSLYSARAGWWSHNPLNLPEDFNQWALETVDGDFPETFETIKEFIDLAVQQNGWLILTFHDIVVSSPKDYETARSDLDKTVQYVYQLRDSIDVVTMSVGMARMLRARGTNDTNDLMVVQQNASGRLKRNR
jgi:peptidoglycan/xylan/chitin deacetylase (PgdA/CDA1 family)